MTLLQAILIGCVAALTQLEGGWLGECKLREPIVTGFLVGLILGDVKTGLIIGAELQMIWMGATGIGPTAQLDIGTGGTIGAAIAIATGTGAESAILFGLPVAVIMQFLNTLLMSGYSGAMLVADRKIDELKFGMVKAIHYLCGFGTFLVYFSLTFMLMYFGGDMINSIVNGLPAWVSSGLNGVAAILPALGFALLLSIIMDSSLIPYFIFGFIPAAFIGHDISMVGIAAMAVAVAMVIFMLRNHADQQPAAVTAAPPSNDWED